MNQFEVYYHDTFTHCGTPKPYPVFLVVVTADSIPDAYQKVKTAGYGFEPIKINQLIERVKS